MGSRAGKAALYLLMALLIAFTGALPSSAQQKSNQKGWLQQQFWQAQRNPQAYQQKQQQRLDLQQQREQRIRDAERAARRAHNVQNGTLNQGTRNPQRPVNDNAVNDNRRGDTGTSSRTTTYARPPSSAKRATPVVLPTDAAKLTPAQIKAGFKNKFANGKALITIGKKTFAINPNGITGNPRSVSANTGKLGTGTTARLTGLIATERTQSGGKLPPGSGGITRASSAAANDNSISGNRLSFIHHVSSRSNFDKRNIFRYAKGIDFSKSVTNVKLTKGTIYCRYQIPGNATGSWIAECGIPATKLGISSKGRNFDNEIVDKISVQCTILEDVDALRSTSAPVVDVWSIDEQHPIKTEGGAIQYWIKNGEKMKCQN